MKILPLILILSVLLVSVVSAQIFQSDDGTIRVTLSSEKPSYTNLGDNFLFAIGLAKTTFQKGETIVVQSGASVESCVNLRYYIALETSGGTIKKSVNGLYGNAQAMTVFATTEFQTSSLSAGSYKIRDKWYCGDLNNMLETSTKSFTLTEPTSTCEEDWVCNSWNPCRTDNIQTRSCTDSNDCGTTFDKPSQTQSCTAPPPVPNACSTLEKTPCQTRSDCTWDSGFLGIGGSCKTKPTEPTENSTSASTYHKSMTMTEDAYNDATTEMLVLSMCKLPGDCSKNPSDIFADESVNVEDYNWTITCKSSQTIKSNNELAMETYLRQKYGLVGAWGVNIMCDSFLSKLGNIASLGLLSQICSQELKEMPTGTCRATIKAESLGFCWQTANQWLSPYTKINDCQTNTILLILIIFLLFFMVMKFAG